MDSAANTHVIFLILKFKVKARAAPTSMKEEAHASKKYHRSSVAIIHAAVCRDPKGAVPVIPVSYTSKTREVRFC